MPRWTALRTTFFERGEPVTGRDGGLAQRFFEKSNSCDAAGNWGCSEVLIIGHEMLGAILPREAIVKGDL